MASGVGNGMAISMNLMHARNERRGKRAKIPEEIARKLKSCSVSRCEDWRDVSAYTTYHCFPTGDKNQERWELWTQLLRKSRDDDSWIPFRGSLVCSHHFRSEDFVNDPHSKRRKLLKNAIPSIFPTFTVDLEDPSFQLPDEESEEGSTVTSPQESSDGFIYADPSSVVMLGDDHDGLDFEYANAEHAFAEVAEAEETFEQVDSIEIDNYDDEIQSISTTPSRSNSFKAGGTAIINAPAKPKLVHMKPTEFIQPQQQQRKRKPPPPDLLQIAPNQIIQLSNGGAKPALKPVSTATVQPRPPKMVQQYGNISQKKAVPPPQMKKNQPLVKAASSMHQFSLNPDLEIEMVDSEDDMTATYKNRIDELEKQNRALMGALNTMKQKYENQLVFLRQRIKDQERLLNAHQISVANNGTPLKNLKKPRFSQ